MSVGAVVLEVHQPRQTRDVALRTEVTVRARARARVVKLSPTFFFTHRRVCARAADEIRATFATFGQRSAQTRDGGERRGVANSGRECVRPAELICHRGFLWLLLLRMERRSAAFHQLPPSVNQE